MKPAGASGAEVLVIEDDNTARKTLGQILEDMGHRVWLAANGEEGLELLARNPSIRLVLCDVVMPGMDGMEVLERIRRDFVGVPVVIMTAFASVAKAVRAMQLGAVDYLEKPLVLVELRNTVTRVLARARERGSPAISPLGDQGLGALVGASPSIRAVFTTVLQVAPTRASILIEGASGTGKELIAREIHRLSGREGPLVPVHCAALPETLIEDELFGHAKGAYTGAATERKGRFEEASGGTLFLDEVSEIPREMQVKLLRVLQEREVIRIGESRARKVDVRIVAASNRDLRAEVQAGRFREDLFFRLNVVRLVVPPLAERREDIRALAEHFLAEKNAINDRHVRAIAPAALRLLEAYSWPGNVRELENVIETGVVLARGDEITPELLPLDVQLLAGTAPPAPPTQEASSDGAAISIPIGTPLEDVEREVILRTLRAADNNKTVAAKILGIGARTLYRKLEQYGVHVRSPEGEDAEGEDPPAD